MISLRTLGLAVKEARRRRGLTQQEVADLAGVTRYWVTNLELGKGNPTFASLTAVLGGVGLSLQIVPTTTEPSSVPGRFLEEPLDLDVILNRTRVC